MKQQANILLPKKTYEQITLFNTVATNDLAGQKKAIGLNEAKNKRRYQLGNEKENFIDVNVNFDENTKEKISGVIDITPELFGEFYKNDLINFPMQYFDFLVYEFTKINPQGTEYPKLQLYFTVKKLQEVFGFYDYQTARREIKKWNNLIFRGFITHHIESRYKNKIGTKLSKIRIVDSEIEIKHGGVQVNITFSFAKHLAYGFLLTLPKIYFSMDKRVALILRKIELHKRINLHDKITPPYILSVQSLLKSNQRIPSYESVMESDDKHIGKRIIKPFEIALECLTEQGFYKWEYCKTKGEPLTDEQLENRTNGIDANFKWETFKDLYVSFTPIATPQIQPATEPPATQEAAQINT